MDPGLTIPAEWPLPQAIRLRLGTRSAGRQRAVAEDGHLLLVLHLPPGPDDAGRIGVLFWRDRAGRWWSSEGGDGREALHRHLHAWADLELQLTRRYEAAVRIDVLFDLVEALTPLARAARNMHDALQQARRAVGHDGLLLDLRDEAYAIDRNFDLLLADVRNAIAYRAARDAEEQARLGREALRASHRLNVLAALFFPLTAVTSVFGMNFERGIDAHVPPLFWLVLAGGVAAGISTWAWVTARARGARQAPRDAGSGDREG